MWKYPSGKVVIVPVLFLGFLGLGAVSDLKAVVDPETPAQVQMTTSTHPQPLYPAWTNFTQPRPPVHKAPQAPIVGPGSTGQTKLNLHVLHIFRLGHLLRLHRLFGGHYIIRHMFYGSGGGFWGFGG